MIVSTMILCKKSNKVAVNLTIGNNERSCISDLEANGHDTSNQPSRKLHCGYRYEEVGDR